MIISEAIKFATEQQEKFGGEMGEFLFQTISYLSELKELRSITKSDNGFTDSLINMGYTKGYEKGRADAIEDVIDNATWNQQGLGGYYKITSEKLEQLKEKRNV